jgi:16S rRNA processing protein RimM
MVLFCVISAMDDAVKIRVGVVGRAHGVHGAIRVFTDEAQSDSLLRVKKVYLGEDENEFNILHATRCGRFIALELEGICDRDKAFEHTGEVVRISRKSLKPLRNAYYACDLAGMEIHDETGKTWGTVKEVVPGTAQDLLRYERVDGGFGLVPFVSAHVGEVDMNGRIIHVQSEWMAGLDEIYGE